MTTVPLHEQARPPGSTSGPSGPDGTRRRRRGSVGSRPLWLLLPGSLLMAVIILLPMALAFWMALTDLDQYTLRDWASAPFIGLDNVREAFSSAGLLHSIGV